MYFEFGQVDQEMLLKIFLFLALVAILFRRAEQLVQSGRGQYEEIHVKSI